MIKSKIALPYKISILALFITICFVIYKGQKEPISLYKKKNIIWEGYIEQINIKEDRVSIILRAKEKLLLEYKIKSKQEKKQIEAYKLGSYIKGKGSIEKVNTNKNFNLFSYRKYLWSKKIWRKCNVEKWLVYKENTKMHYQIKNSIIEKINKSPSKAYLHTFLLGDTSYIKKEVKESYQKNGISHLFAISGMHITLLASFLLHILKKIGAKDKTSYSICILFLLFYAFLTNLTPSVMRSTLFFILLTIKRFLPLKIEKVPLYLFLTCAFLLYNPYCIYHTGFLYSFTISFFLLCYGKKFCKNKYIYDSFVISTTAFFASLPIQINSNFEINVLSVGINMLLSPFLSCILFPLTLICFFIPIDFFLSFIILLFEKTSMLLSGIYLPLIFPKIEKIEIICYYSILLYIGTYNIKKIYILFLVLLYFYIKPVFAPSYLTMIDVGQADSLLLHAKRENILIDTGGKYTDMENAREAKEIVLYIKSKGIRKLDALFVTHGEV